MKSLISDKLRKDTFMKMYFGDGELKKAGLRRAYLDFNRTFTIQDKSDVGQKNRLSIKESTENYIGELLQDFLEIEFLTQKEFDKMHLQIAVKIKLKWNELEYGQIQKWINMTLKYWLLMGDDKINGIELNANFFHIPIDNIILLRLFDEKYPKKAWSKLNYEEYMDYQKKFRTNKPNTIPILVEFETFNK